MCRRYPMGLLLWLAVAVPTWAQIPEGYIIFKDGFTIHGKVVQQKKFEIDPGSGVVYSIASGFTTLDDDVRRIYFPPGQIDKVVPLKTAELNRDMMVLARQPITPRKPLLMPAWYFDTLPPFDKVWERHVTVLTPKGKFPMHQRIVVLSPKHMWIQSLTHNWDQHFSTKELGLEGVVKLLTDFYDTKKEAKDLTPVDKRFLRAKFLKQAGWIEAAETEVRALQKEAPEFAKSFDEFLEGTAKDRAKLFMEELDNLAQAKQHRQVQERLVAYEKLQLADKVPATAQLLIQDLKNRYDAENEKLAKVRVLFKDLMARDPKPRGRYVEYVDTIQNELNHDTVARLDTFVTFAEQFKRDADGGKTPAHKLEQVLALAVTGWHLGNIAAEPDVKLAEKLWKVRRQIPEYMKTDTIGQRTPIADKIKELDLPIDVFARLLQHLPPPNAMEKFKADAFDVDLDLPDGPTGTYHLKLPPDYHHQRAYPLLILIHGRERPEDLVLRWAPLAAKYGFILAAPRWFKFTNASAYGYSDRENKFFMNCLKDLKRRFQIDTDRVFAYGWDTGAHIAWDIGLAHPDQFAGVLPMCGVPSVISQKYLANAQYLPLYIVDGDKSGNGPVLVRNMFKDFIRGNYPAYYLEYKGRGNELFVTEFDPMMEWMSRKRRMYPTKAIGNYHTGGGAGDEFKSYRMSDNRFYWLQSDEIDDNCLEDYSNWKKKSPAKFHAAITVANESDSKGNARIYSQVNLRTFGLKQATVWLSPALIDFTKPVQLRVNGRSIGNTRMLTPSIGTLLEEYFSNVDRARLYYARLDMKI